MVSEYLLLRKFCHMELVNTHACSCTKPQMQAKLNEEGLAMEAQMAASSKIINMI
jgi:hypothetical protein